MTQPRAMRLLPALTLVFALTVCGVPLSAPAEPVVTIAPTVQPTETRHPERSPFPQEGAQSKDALSPPTELAPTADSLGAALREGGYILLFRHAATDATPADAAPVNLADCSTQRRLSEQGRALATSVGVAIRRLGIPVGDVLTSPYCRTLDTANLMFGRATPVPELAHLSSAPDAAARAAHIAALETMLNTAPAAGTNTILITHSPNLAAVGVSLAEGGAAIFRPQPDAEPQLIATLAPDDWE